MSQTNETYIEKVLRESYRPGMRIEDYFKKLYLIFYTQNCQAAINNSGYKPSTRQIMYQNLQEVLYYANDPDFPCDEGFVPKQKREVKPTYTDIANAMYVYRRSVNYVYPADNNYTGWTDRLSDETALTNEEANQWIFRTPKNRHQMGWHKGDKTVERLILNVKPRPEVIDILDDFCLKHKCYYKTPDVDRFFSRTDTVVIYSKAYFSEEDKQELVQKLSPYIRKSLPERTNDLDGQKLADGIFIAPEYSKDDLEQHIIGLKSPFEHDLRMASDIASFKVSLGNMKIFEQMTAAVQKYFPHYGETWLHAVDETARTMHIKRTYDTKGNPDKWIILSKNQKMTPADIDLINQLNLNDLIPQKNEQGEISGFCLNDVSNHNRCIIQSVLARQQYDSQKQENIQTHSPDKENEIPQKNIYPAQYDDIVKAFDISYERNTNAYIFIPKNKKYLASLEMLDSIGLHFQPLKSNKTGEAYGFGCPNSVSNHKIIMRLLDRKKRISLEKQKENHRKQSNQTSDLSVQQTAKIDAVLKHWTVRFNDNSKKVEFIFKGKTNPVQAYQALKNIGLKIETVVDKTTGKPKSFEADMKTGANEKIIQSIVIRLNQIKKVGSRSV